MKKLYLFALAVVILTSCSKEEELAPRKEFIPSVFREFNNEHSVSIQRWTLNNIPKNLRINGQFLQKGNLTANASLRVNGAAISPDEQSAFTQFHLDQDEGFEEVHTSHDGQMVDVDVEVMGTAETASVYSPKDLVIQTSQNIRSLNRSEDLTITWNPDPENPFGDISIALISRGIDGYPDESTKDLHHTVVIEDSGSHTIPSSAFENWPIGLHIDLSLTRANQQLMPKTNTLVTAFIHTLNTGEIEK